MKVYIACSSQEPERARWAMDAVRRLGCEVAHDWLRAIEEDGAANEGLDSEARLDRSAECLEALDDLGDEDVFWLLVPVTNSAGAWAEFGYVLARERHCDMYELPEIVVSGSAVESSIFTAQADAFDCDDNALQYVSSLAARWAP